MSPPKDANPSHVVNTAPPEPSHHDPSDYDDSTVDRLVDLLKSATLSESQFRRLADCAHECADAKAREHSKRDRLRLLRGLRKIEERLRKSISNMRGRSSAQESSEESKQNTEGMEDDQPENPETTSRWSFQGASTGINASEEASLKDYPGLSNPSTAPMSMKFMATNLLSTWRLFVNFP